MKTWYAWLMAIAMLLPGPARAEDRVLTVGIVPYLTPNVLMALFQPLRVYLEKQVGCPVELYTAPDVKSFVRRTLKPDFDLVITAAHHARLAELEGGYLPLARFTGPLHAAVAVGRDSPLRELKDLKGRRIAVTDRTILVTIVTLKALADLGIGDKDLRLVAVNSQNTGLITVGRGDADAAVIAHFTLDQSPPEQREGLRILYQSPVLPNVTLLARPTLAATELEAVRRALARFPKTPEGQDFLQKSRFLGMAPADETFMKRLDPYLAETRRQLAQ